jgi:hypothetical protein
VGIEIVLSELEYVVVVILQRIRVHFFLYVLHLQQFLLYSELSPLIAFDVFNEAIVVLPISTLLQVMHVERIKKILSGKGVDGGQEMRYSLYQGFSTYASWLSGASSVILSKELRPQKKRKMY